MSFSDIKQRMNGAIESFKKDLASLRTGRASVSMLEPVVVDAYGAKMPIAQVGNISAPEPRLLTVSVWDTGMVSSVEKAIRESGLGLNPQPEGTLIRIPVPELNEERRIELAKVAGKYAEQAKISVRNVRRDGMDTLKKQEKDGDISEDELRSQSDTVQKLTDEHVKKIEELHDSKEQEIKAV